MKQIFKFICLGLMVFCLGGCNLFKIDMMEDINIYTTIYPYSYLVEYLYGDNAKVYSIYPSGVSINDYKLSNKKIKEYSYSDLFVFNSLDRDRDYAIDMINYNNDLKIIDVTMGMDYEYGLEQLWLNPYNYLMMAKNVKDGLNEYISNPYLEKDIEEKYSTLQYDLSSLDANFKKSIENSSYNTIVVSNDVLKFLEKYNLNVISLEENDNLTTPVINEVKKLITSGEIKYIYSTNSNTSNETVNSLVSEYGIEVVYINTMHSIDGGISNSNDNYLTVMNSNIDLLKKELYK